MQSVKLTKPVMILMYGYPGSGKTFFARQFAESIGAFHLSSDRIRHQLFDEPQFNPEENDVVLGMMDYILEDLLSSGISIVYDDQNNVRSKRKKLQELAKLSGHENLLVWVQTDAVTAFDRASNRDRRNPDDKFSYQINRETFNRLKDEMSKPDREEYVVISGKHVFINQFRVARSKLAQLGLISNNSAPASNQPRSSSTHSPQPNSRIIRRINNRPNR